MTEIEKRKSFSSTISTANVAVAAAVAGFKVNLEIV